MGAGAVPSCHGGLRRIASEKGDPAMRRTACVLFLSFSLSGLWGQLWHWLSPPGAGIRPVPTCGGGSGNPDGCPPGTIPH